MESVGFPVLEMITSEVTGWEWTCRRQARLMKRLLTVPDPLLHYIVTGQIPELHDMPKMLGWMDGFRITYPPREIPEPLPCSLCCSCSGIFLRVEPRQMLYQLG